MKWRLRTFDEDSPEEIFFYSSRIPKRGEGAFYAVSYERTRTLMGIPSKTFPCDCQRHTGGH